MRADAGNPGLVLKLVLEPVIFDSELPDSLLIESDVAALLLVFSAELGDSPSRSRIRRRRVSS
jgi:hypothetical protein